MTLKDNNTTNPFTFLKFDGIPSYQNWILNTS